MNWFSWCCVVMPLFGIVYMAFYVKRYIRGVADYLVAGRVAGRYVISVGELEGALSVLTLISMIEVNYNTGFALTFWRNVLIPIGILLGLMGYVSYRFRETRSMSMGQFLEMRYSRSFRFFAAILRTLSEILANCIGPAVSARFFIYLLGFPHTIPIFNWEVSTFVLLLAVILILALIIIWAGGQLALIVTDCIQGLMCYPIFVIFSVFFLTEFSWNTQIAPVMMDRVSGESFLNPYDIQSLRDFNLFALLVTLLGSFLNRGCWIGTGFTGCGRTPHEQKMAGILGTWRQGFSAVMCILLTIAVLAFLSHSDFSGPARKVRTELTGRIADELVKNPATRQRVSTAVASLPEQRHRIGIDQPFSRQKNPDTVYLNSVHKELSSEDGGNALFQQFRTLYFQMLLPATMRNLLPPALLTLFVLMCVMLMLSSDDSRIFSSAQTIIQDIVMPCQKKPMSPQTHIRWLRFCSIIVGVIFFIGSIFLSQLDYLLLFSTITTSLWVGGAGSVIVFGLYSRFGTTAGAYASLLTGGGVTLGGILVQRSWADLVYPWLDDYGMVPALDNFLQTVSAPFNPYVVWMMDPVKFPVNSTEIFFIAMLSSFSSYCIVSWLTCRKPFNLEKMLHRGIYSEDSGRKAESPWTWRNVYGKLIGITSEYSRGDKVIAWGVFFYAIVYRFVIAVLMVIAWNAVSPWPMEYWSWYFWITCLVIPSVLGVVSTVWFTAGGIIDLRRLFVDLRQRRNDPLDDGRVDDKTSGS